MNRILKFLLALSAFPAITASAFCAGRLVLSVFLKPAAAFPFVIGACAYPAVHYGGLRWVRMYVLAHELTHACAAYISGVKVKGISVGRAGGYVKLSGSSAFISLAPYCLPLYAIAVTAAYWILLLSCGMSEMRPYFVAAFGFFTAYHLIFTAETLFEREQSDLVKAGGVFFSSAVIIFSNSVFLILSLKFLFPDMVNAGAAVSDVRRMTSLFWQSAWQAGAYAVKYFYG